MHVYLEKRYFLENNDVRELPTTQACKGRQNMCLTYQAGRLIMPNMHNAPHAGRILTAFYCTDFFKMTQQTHFCGFSFRFSTWDDLALGTLLSAMLFWPHSEMLVEGFDCSGINGPGFSTSDDTLLLPLLVATAFLSKQWTHTYPNLLKHLDLTVQLNLTALADTK